MKSLTTTMLSIAIFLSAQLVPVYEAGKIVPKYYIQQRDNEIRIYKPDNLLIPQYVIRDGKIYNEKCRLIPKYNSKGIVVVDGDK